MKNRIIGGAGFVISFYLLLLIWNLFIIFIGTIFIVGIYEFMHIIRKSNKKFISYLYLISFLMFIYGLWYLSLDQKWFLVYITAVLMYNDTFAYFVGKNHGKTKLTSISPNKTVEGSIGGLLISPFVAIITLSLVSVLFNFVGDYNPFNSLLILYIISVVIAILGQIGDILESYIKRQSNIKDSGNFIYGHGGILDRIDSWILPIIIIILFI